MTRFKSTFLKVLNERGYIHQGTDLAALDEKALKECLAKISIAFKDNQ